jgi:tRNA(fMet)-specific endonuclease VapC
MYAGNVMVWLLDSDHISLILRQDPKVSAKLVQQAYQTAVSVITVQEVCNGWLGLLNQKHQSREEMLHRYHQFWLAIEFFKTIPILEFDDRAYDRCIQLITDNPALRKQDLQRDVRIAALAKPLV